MYSISFSLLGPSRLRAERLLDDCGVRFAGQQDDRIAPHIVDTLFLATGIGMLLATSLNPFTQPWLIAKFAGLILYVLLGTVAIKRGSNKGIRMGAFIGALCTFAYIVGVGLTRSTLSWMAFLDS